MLRYRVYLFLATILCVSLFISDQSRSQVIVDAPNINKASSQLLYYYDQTEGTNQGGTDPETIIQVTNTNDTQAITIHVQIFRSYDPDSDGSQPAVICDERNFVDFLTPNDTHIYDLSQGNFPKNEGENETTAGESTSVDVTVPETGTKGFVIITPVVSESDLTAVSFQHLIGSSIDYDASFLLNARGRDAVDFVTGEDLPDFTPLDGVNSGFEIVQSDIGTYSFSNDFGPAFFDVVFISVQDVYGDPGLLGYTVAPATSSFSTFIYDYKEDVTSCGNREFTCFLTVGVNDTFPQNNTELSNGNDVLCAGVESPLNPNILEMARGVDLTVATVQVDGEDEAQGFLKFFFDTNNEASQVSQEVTAFASFFNIGVTSPDPCACAHMNHEEKQTAVEIDNCPSFCFEKPICPVECTYDIRQQLAKTGSVTTLNVECPPQCCDIFRDEFNLNELQCPMVP